MSAAAIWLAGLLFGVSHTLLAGRTCRDFAAQRGVDATRYRLLYSLLATLLTCLWLGLAWALPDTPLYAVSGIAALPLHALQLAGLFIALSSFRVFDAGVFLGLKTMPATGEPFVERGAYRHMRHPMYTGVMLMLLASPEHTVNSLNLALAISVYFIVGSRFEERRMLAMHPEYATYREHVPAFLPRTGLFRARAAAQSRHE